MIQRLLPRAGALAALALLSATAFAQAGYPSRTITIVVP